MRNAYFAAALSAALALPACAGVPAVDAHLVDQAAGRVLQIYAHRGSHWVAGEPGERYAIRLTNRSAERVLAVVSVDGINVITGETAHPSQSGYVLEPYASQEIAGWRKSMQEVASFYFTAIQDSYAARTERPGSVGVIGVAVFQERPRPMPPAASVVPEAGDSAAEPAGPARAPAPAVKRSAEAERLGTGHGERRHAPAQYVRFERATETPARILTMRYDSRANLLARGVIPRLPRYADPEPFPGLRFAPDPRG